MNGEEVRMAADAVLSARQRRYTDLSYLAQGGMQYVFRAYDSALGRWVALKTPKSGTVDRRFRRGAELSSRLNHPNIASTLDYYEDDTVTFVVEELVDGLNLRQVFDRDYFFLDPWLAATVVHQLARALSVAHDEGIVHRDIKPSNVLLNDEPSLSTVKLTDFGIAKLAAAQLEYEIEEARRDETTITRSQTLLGALPYLAPECWDNWAGVETEADVWALGALLYELLAGEPPFGFGPRSIVNIGRYSAGGFDLRRPVWFGKSSSAASLESELWSLIEAALVVEPSDRAGTPEILARCEALCYASGSRNHGTISMYPSSRGFRHGRIRAGDVDYFFHGDEFFGSTGAAPGQRVSFVSYPGVPNARCQPVLGLRPSTLGS